MFCITKNLILISTILLWMSLAIGQRERFTFYKANSFKEKKIKAYTTIVVHTKDFHEGDSVKQKAFYYGNLVSKEDSFLVLTNAVYIQEKSIITASKEQEVNEQVIYNDTLIQVPIHSVKYIQKENKIQQITPAIATFTALTGSFLAPIIAYNFKTKTFNQDVYLAIAPPSTFIALGAIAIGTSYQKRKLYLTPSQLN